MNFGVIGSLSLKVSKHVKRTLMNAVICSWNCSLTSLWFFGKDNTRFLLDDVSNPYHEGLMLKLV